MNYLKKATDAAKSATQAAVSIATDTANKANTKVQEAATKAAQLKKIKIEDGQDIICHYRYGWATAYQKGGCCTDPVQEPGVTLKPELSRFLTQETMDLIKKTIDSVYYDLDKTEKDNLQRQIDTWNTILKIDLCVIFGGIIAGSVLIAAYDVVIGVLVFLLGVFAALYVLVIANQLRKYKFAWSRFNLLLLNDKINELNSKYFGQDKGIDFMVRLERDHKPMDEYLEKEKTHMEREKDRLQCAICCALFFECVCGCGGADAFFDIMCDCNVFYEVDVQYKGKLLHQGQIIGINAPGAAPGAPGAPGGGAAVPGGNDVELKVDVQQ